MSQSDVYAKSQLKQISRRCLSILSKMTQFLRFAARTGRIQPHDRRLRSLLLRIKIRKMARSPVFRTRHALGVEILCRFLSGQPTCRPSELIHAGFSVELAADQLSATSRWGFFSVCEKRNIRKNCRSARSAGNSRPTCFRRQPPVWESLYASPRCPPLVLRAR